jgi:hypothetical protein
MSLNGEGRTLLSVSYRTVPPVKQAVKNAGGFLTSANIGGFDACSSPVDSVWFASAGGLG